MSSEAKFPANSVLDWYVQAEQMLVNFLKYVPYCATHEEIWSPKLVVVLQETCSQLDSLWRWEGVNIHSKKNNKVDISDYFKLFGADVAKRWVVFWADEPEKIQPFSEWQETQYHPLDWWTEGYNKVKHNRLENRCCATLKCTVEALSSLFLAIIRCEKCWDTLWERHWMSWDDSGEPPFDPFGCLRADFILEEDRGKCGTMHMAVESQLFTYAVGLCTGLIKPRKKYPHWKGNCSRRFKAWYYNYSQKL